MIDVFNFDQKTFGQLLSQIEATRRPGPGYHKLPLAEIEAYIAFIRGDETLPPGVADAIVAPLEKFLAFKKQLGMELNEAAIASFKIGADGVTERFYGPALFRQEDEIVLRVGDTLVPVTLAGINRINVGNLTGKVTFKTFESGDTEYTRASAVLRGEGEDRFGISAIMTNEAAELSDYLIEDQLEEGLSLVELLNPVGSGSGSKYLKLAELELDKTYEVLGVDCTGKPEYGRHRLIISVDGAEKVCSTNAALKTVLETYASQLEQAKAYTPEAMTDRFKGYKLAVTEKTEFKNGRWKCSVKLTPKTTMAGFNGKAKPATASPVTILDVQEVQPKVAEYPI
jgi:hypothetical protein